jgi:hypothetical protein
MVSKNGLSVFMRFQAIKLEVGRQAPAIFPQPGQQLLCAGFFLKLENPLTGDMNFF